ncbi:MAG TPA: YtxH domain-containing protein [Acidobacteriota bacterium]|nr:YtxH domain-containing protein [Acidobacteriota bacterium]
MSRQTGKFLTILTGGLIGASVALLLAPQSGKKTRRQLVRYGRKAGLRAQDFVSEIGNAMDHVLGDILDFRAEGVVKGKELTARAREEILNVLDAGKKYIEQERTKLEKILR